MKNIIIHSHMNIFNYTDGGTMVQYKLASILEEYGINVRIYSYEWLDNPVFNKYYNNDFPIDDNCIVIYCEAITDNPLNASNVVYWLLSELGQNVPYDRFQYWKKNELVYYFNSELKLYENPERIGTIYKMLNIIYIHPSAVNHNSTNRKGRCHTFRKCFYIHKNITVKDFIHTDDSILIPDRGSQERCIDIFNECLFFISYDSNSFLTILAALCGCISIVYKIEGHSKEDWLKKTVCYEYFKHIGKYELYGVAYGIEEIEYAKSTLHLVQQQWKDILEYSKQQTVIPFINDMQNFENNLNTVGNNFY